MLITYFHILLILIYLFLLILTFWLFQWELNLVGLHEANQLFSVILSTIKNAQNSTDKTLPVLLLENRVIIEKSLTSRNQENRKWLCIESWNFWFNIFHILKKYTHFIVFHIISRWNRINYLIITKLINLSIYLIPLYS